MSYYDKCKESYNLFEIARLPAIVVLVLTPYANIWQFLSNNREAADADNVAKFLVEVLLRATDTRSRAVACWALTSWGLEPSLWLKENRASIANDMATLFHSTESWAAGRGRVALAVAHFGGGSRCRGMLADVSDKSEKVKLSIFIAGKLNEDEAAQLLGF